MLLFTALTGCASAACRQPRKKVKEICTADNQNGNLTTQPAVESNAGPSKLPACAQNAMYFYVTPAPNALMLYFTAAEISATSKRWGPQQQLFVAATLVCSSYTNCLLC